MTSRPPPALTVSGRPVTYTGRVVSWPAWGQLSDFERYGPTALGLAWSPWTRTWEAAEGPQSSPETAPKYSPEYSDPTPATVDAGRDFSFPPESEVKLKRRSMPAQGARP